MLPDGSALVQKVMKRSHHLLPRLFQVLGGFLMLALMVSMAVYGVTVYLENKVVSVGADTRVLQLDNQDLQIQLDKLRSYQNVADASSRIQGLKPAEEVIHVAEKPPVSHPEKKAPEPLPPKTVYGY